MAINVIVTHPGDNVAVAVRDIESGEEVLGEKVTKVTARTDVARNHKVAIEQIPEGSEVIKYGEPIGLAGETIQPGEWIHTHNLKSKDV